MLISTIDCTECGAIYERVEDETLFPGLDGGSPHCEICGLTLKPTDQPGHRVAYRLQAEPA